jgi:hypothetical protein
LPRIKNMVGFRVGKLTVIEFIGIEKCNSEYGNRQLTKTMWKCKCDCGNEIVVARTNLRSSHTQSCGCLRVEIGKRLSQKQKEEILHLFFNVGISMKQISTQMKINQRTVRRFIEQERKVELTIEQIKEIKDQFFYQGISLHKIAQLMGMPFKTIRTCCNGPYKRWSEDDDFDPIY